jgi:HSP20 family molecular chaperone IbpA
MSQANHTPPSKTAAAQQSSQSTQSTQASQSAREDASLYPPVDVIEDAAGITLYADLPGVPKEHLHIHVEAETLSIEAEVALDMPTGIESTHAEVALPRYRRVFTLSKELDTEQVAAEFDKGVLTLRIPKVAHAQPKKVQIRVE